MNKYKAQKTTVDGITFDSRKEAERYIVLRALEKAGVISGLKTQERYELIPMQNINGVKMRNIEYIADFVYTQNGREVVEDVKGYKNPASAAYAKYVIKKKLMAWKYGIIITEA